MIGGLASYLASSSLGYGCSLCVPTVSGLMCTGRCGITGTGPLIVYQNLTPPEIESLNPQLFDLVAYRVWLIKDSYLFSTSINKLWLPNEIIEGDVSSAGVHAYKSLESAIRHYTSSPSFALGTVRLWGAIVEHEFGYRASYARLLSILDVQISSPWSDERRHALAFFQAKYNYIEKESENDVIS